MTPLFVPFSNRRGMVGLLAVLFLFLLLGTISSTIILQASAKYRQAPECAPPWRSKRWPDPDQRARAELRRSPN
jgi:hypothetical protein